MNNRALDLEKLKNWADFFDVLVVVLLNIMRSPADNFYLSLNKNIPQMNGPVLSTRYQSIVLFIIILLDATSLSVKCHYAILIFSLLVLKILVNLVAL